jgi:hypothetical protein
VTVSMSVPEILIDKALEVLEVREYQGLQWGFVNGGFTQIEIEEAIHETLQMNSAVAVGVSSDDLLNLLLDRSLLLALPGQTGETLYRTRFAETIRLISHLRQLFPSEKRHWSEFPKLVSDYRIIRKARLYPRRHITGSDLVNYLEIDCGLGLDTKSRNAIGAIVSDKHLAQFQRDSTARILSSRHQSSVQGTIICAGTGTGKTLAFYLPCFTAMVSELKANVFDTLCLAIYPRNELLKDQFHTAFINARRLDSVGSRALRIAVFNGSTPKDAAAVRQTWQQHGPSWAPTGYVCPFFRCPNCRGDLIWRSKDIVAKLEQLFCDSCKSIQTTAKCVPLTRNSIEEQPPDVLFTTTEMLNRSLSNRKRHRMLGIDTTDRLRYVLLDEAHTYTGVSGAHNALLLKRWKQLRRRGHSQSTTVHFVGLSATLLNPQRFFAELIGEPESVVEAIGVGKDLEAQGWEYQLAIRGNAAEKASLLSTSIQTIMLLARMLDPLGCAVSNGKYPGKVFAFTDDLDVTNRFFFNLQDAEGLDGRQKQVKRPLAFERRSTNNGAQWNDRFSRNSDGQNWMACEKINGNTILNCGLALDRVSSQDTGVNPDAKVIIATAALEVGFDDDAVGAVVQHKASRSAASFLQRKGRAGRKQNANPWTVIVLSDFGRDRTAYQGYDQLFNPELDRSDLPVRNRYVLKIQSVFALMDYLQFRLSRQYSDVWNALTYSADSDWSMKRREELCRFVEALLTQDGERRKFCEYLQNALGASEEEVQALLWLPPRALMTEVLPTVIRRLESNFEGEKRTVGYTAQRNPLPEFIPNNLFSNLLTPEVTIVATGANGTIEYEESMGIVQALSHTTPGRVTRRYAISSSQEHWLPPGFLDGKVDFETQFPNTRTISVSEYLQGKPVDSEIAQQSYIEATDARYFDAAGNSRLIQIHRPQKICLQSTTQRLPILGRVVSTSRTSLCWRTQFHPHGGENQTLLLLGKGIFSTWIPRIHFFTFNTGNPLRVQRFAIGCEGTLVYQSQTTRDNFGPATRVPIEVRFTENAINSKSSTDPDVTAGIGFEMEVDAIGFECQFSVDLMNTILFESLSDLRVPYFYHNVLGTNELSGFSRFDKEWFAQVGVSIFSGVAAAKKCSMADAVNSCIAEPAISWARKVDHALRSIFQLTLDHELTDENVVVDEDTAGTHAHAMSGRFADLLEHLKSEKVRSALTNAANVLFAPPDPSWFPWLGRRLRSTLGGALVNACHEIAREYQAADLYLDVDGGPPTTSTALDEVAYSNTLWISENIPGSAGVIEQVRRVLLHDRDRFIQLVENSLRGSRWEVLGLQLSRILDLTVTNASVQNALASVREAVGIESLNIARENLFEVLRQNGISVSHSVINAVNVRILQPSSSSVTDNLLKDLIEKWERSELTHQMHIDARIFAYIASRDESIKPRMVTLLMESGHENPASDQLYNAIYSMLWPRGYQVRERAFDIYNPFVELPTSDPVLLERRVDSTDGTLIIRDLSGTSISTMLAQLKSVGIAKVSVSIADKLLLKKFILQLVATPIETGFLVGYPRIGQSLFTEKSISITVTLPEAQIV